MTVKEAVVELCRRNPSENALLSPESIAPLADAITNSTWSDAVILSEHQEAWLEVMGRIWNGKPVSDSEYKEMESWMVRFEQELTMIHRYGPCIGLTLFKWKRFKIEIWFAPKWYAAPEHTHNESDGEFFILWARNRPIYRVVNGKREWYDAHTPGWGRCLSVRAGTPHAFLRGTSPMLWICFEKWKSDKVTSVATDLHLTDSSLIGKFVEPAAGWNGVKVD